MVPLNSTLFNTCIWHMMRMIHVACAYAEKSHWWCHYVSQNPTLQCLSMLKSRFDIALMYPPPHISYAYIEWCMYYHADFFMRKHRRRLRGRRRRTGVSSDARLRRGAGGCRRGTNSEKSDASRDDESFFILLSSLGTYERHMKEIWETYERHMRNIWETYEKHMRDIWETYERRMRDIWETYERHMTDKWEILITLSGITSMRETRNKMVLTLFFSSNKGDTRGDTLGITFMRETRKKKSSPW